ncbi:MAG TPA: hypothetical protein VFH70_04815, partial [Acidimicrobiales bacterium]|nr:hypothetical protein [Acidimicrobiales bacterium]
MTGLRAVILDLDDTLIVEEAKALSSLRSTASLLPGADPDHVADVVLACARAAWRAGPHHPLAVELGVASWEGLWARFDGCHPRLRGLAEWAPVFRESAWASAVAELGHDDPALASAMAAAYDASQRSGHPLIEGADAAVRAVAGRYRLALLTNGPADIQRLKLEQT